MKACLAAEPMVVVAYLFGSVAMGRADHMSDVDIAVLLDAMLDKHSAFELELRLADRLAGCSKLEVQLASLNDAPPLLAYEVVCHGILLHARSEQERVAFQVQACKTYFDFKPWLDFHTRVLLDDIMEVGLSGRRKRPGGTPKAARAIRERLARIRGYQSRGIPE
ncbi:MAG: type VII toxin-antitoxin system MntA family adenylyltransferase antitoxin [Anaerolineae bacterium]